MRKIKIGLLFLLFCLTSTISFSQQNQDELGMNVTKILNESGDKFEISLSVSNTNTVCGNNRFIELNIGALRYDLSILGNDWSIDTSNATNGILILNDNTPPVGAGGNYSHKIKVFFPEGTTCNNFSQNITATLRCSNQSLIDLETRPVFSTTVNNSQLTISPASTNPSSNPICLGNSIYKYIVKLSNVPPTAANTLNLANAKVKLNLSSCAQFISVKKYSTNTQLAFTFDDANDKVEWNINNLNSGIPNNQSFWYEIYVKYPCVTCGSTIVHPYGFVSGTNTCIAGELTSNTTNQITVNTSSSCGSCNGGVGTFDDTNTNFPCPQFCNPTLTINYKIDSPSGSFNPDSTVLFIADVPSGIGNPINVQTSSPASSNYVLEYYYNNIWNSSLPTSSTPQVEKIKWTFQATSTGSSYVSCLVKYENSNLSNVSPLPYSYKLYKNSENVDNIVYQGNRTAVAFGCNESLTITKKVKAKDAASSTYANNMYANPSDTLTYRIDIRNSNADVNNVIIEDNLDLKHVYAGNFKYNYSTNNLVTLYPLNITPNSSAQITDFASELGNITVEVTNNKIKLSGFNFISPCGDFKYLTIEFDVVVNSTLYYGDQIPNSIKIFKDNYASPVSTSSLGGSTLVTISDLFSVKNKFSVKCPYSIDNQWLQSVNVREGDIVDFKMSFSNDGSVPVLLKDLVNLKPMLNDKLEVGINGSYVNRNSQYAINYVCGSFNTTTNSSSPISTFDYSFSSGSPNMNRMITLPNQNFANEPSSFYNNCIETATWVTLNINDNEGIVLQPGQNFDLIYKGVVMGTTGQTAYNSFSFRAYDYKNANLNNPINSENSNVVSIIVGDEGCLQPPPPCYDCTSFDLLKEEKYLVSAWVKEEYENYPEQQFKGYSKSSVMITFTDVTGAVINTPFEFYPSGEIIDGWQRIIGEFVVPLNVDDMILELVNLSDDGKVSYFDDVRVLPSRGNMKSFVYDQKTQRLMAELDENNYSTFYEYDLEGGLIRIKKETEKGVFTIQETRSGNVKN